MSTQVGLEEPKLMIKDIAKRYAERGADHATLALENTSFHIADREIVCLLGPSGCGKSTILRIIAGFDFPSTGEVYLDGKRVTKPGPDRGVVFQEQALFPWMSLYQNIISGPKFRGLPTGDYEEKARDFLKVIGLEHFANHYPHELSGGMKQRVAIARALINAPAVLLMDEPFGALDAQTRTLMQEWLLSLWHASPRAILFITHDVEEAVFLADRVLLMSARPGRVKQSWSIDLPRPRDWGTRSQAAFVALKRDIMAAMRHET